MGAPDTPSASSTADVQADRSFDRLSTCSECVAAGYGWSTRRQRCGGYRNKRCDATVPDTEPASGPWMLGSPLGSVGQTMESTTSARRWLDVVDSQSASAALGVVLLVALAWWGLRCLWQTQASGFPRALPPRSKVGQKKHIETESSGAERAAAAGRRHNRGRTTPPVPPCSVLRSGFSTKSVTQACDTNRTALRFAPTPEVRFFKPRQQMATPEQRHLRKKQVAALELADPIGSLVARTRSNGGGCGATDRTHLSKPNKRGAPPAPAPVEPDLAYIFGPP